MRLADETAAALRAALAGVRYKPGWSFEVVEQAVPFDGPPLLRICARVPDAYAEPSALLPIVSVVHMAAAPPVGDDWDRDRWREWLLGSVRQAEDHETREWLTFGGERPFDPHREAAR